MAAGALRRFGSEALTHADDSDASASSGVHDSAGSVSPTHSRKRRSAAAYGDRRDDARLASGSLSGSDPISSRGSSGGRHCAHNGHACEVHAESTATMMPRVPEVEQVWHLVRAGCASHSAICGHKWLLSSNLCKVHLRGSRKRLAVS